MTSAGVSVEIARGGLEHVDERTADLVAEVLLDEGPKWVHGMFAFGVFCVGVYFVADVSMPVAKLYGWVFAALMTAAPAAAWTRYFLSSRRKLRALGLSDAEIAQARRIVAATREKFRDYGIETLRRHTAHALMQPRSDRS